MAERVGAIIVILLFQSQAKAQDDWLDSLEAALETDSVTILHLVDSLLNVETYDHDLTLKVTYISQVLTAGRDFGIDQYGLSPGISYFHKSGLFADINGFWNSDYEPNYNMTILSAGYLWLPNRWWSNTASYEHYFFNGETSNLTNSFDLSSMANFNFLDLGVDYSDLFGKETAHRVRGSIGGYIKIKKLGFFDRITFSPAFSVLWGNANVLYRKFLFEEFTPDQQYQWSQLSPLQRSRLLRRWYQQLLENKEDLLVRLYDEKNVFGLMNYTFSMPVRFSINNTNVSFNYSYTIPVALPGEHYEYEDYGFFSLAIFQSIRF